MKVKRRAVVVRLGSAPATGAAGDALVVGLREWASIEREWSWEFAARARRTTAGAAVVPNQLINVVTK
ncbi:MAG: hypothetical protein WDN00_09985 [Limisphaerales bacterium]